MALSSGMQKRLIHHLLLLMALIFGSGAAAPPLAEPQANGVLVTHSLHHLQRESFEQVGLVEVGVFKAVFTSIRAAAAAIKCTITGGCFSAGHQVITKERGLVAIETVRQGEHVLSRDEQGKEYYAEVTDTFTRHDSFLCELRYRLPSGEDRMNSVTPEHPYSRDGKEWIGAKDLKAGDSIGLKQGFATVVGLRTFAAPNDGTFTVFNITVNDAHSYFVLPPGKTGIEEAVWVHNIMCWKELPISAPVGWAKHHLISFSVGSKNATLQYLDSLGLYNINSATNGLALPTDILESLLHSLPLHNGGHLQSYYQFVRDKLASLDALRAAGASDADLVRRALEIEMEIRDALLNGTIRLQNGGF